MANDIVLETRGLVKKFGEAVILNGIDFTLHDKEVAVILGPSGCGKSTFLRCLIGLEPIQGGSILLKGKPLEFGSTLRSGIGMVFQSYDLFPHLTVLENILLAPLHVAKRSREDALAQAETLLKRVKLWDKRDFYPRQLSGGQKQRVAIAGVVAMHPKCIVLDEPTSSLTVQEVNKLFEMMRMLKEQGIALIYISHKMDEIFEICDQVSVLRDGNLVMTKDSKDTNMGELITAMVGRSLESRFPPVDNIPGDPILSIQHLSTKYAPYLQDISFDVREGEIFGLYGLVGAGRTELLETIFGVRTRAAGRVYFRDHLMNFNNAHEAIEHGFALITEERKANGLFLKSDLTFNTTIANLDQYKGGLGLSMPKMVKATNKEIKVMHTKCMGPDDMITSLSGGNQQKVIFGKWLEREPQVFMMDEPTRGIDVGAKYEIYELIIKMAKQGKTIIVVSSEMPEILGITNRIGVMSNGHLSGIVNTKETNQEELLRLSAKYL